MTLLFGSTYLCEQVFSRMNHVKSPVRSLLSDSHMKNSLRISTSSILPNIAKLVRECLFYLPFLSSIHEKANCIAILWTGSPHSLGSCLFRGLWAKLHIEMSKCSKSFVDFTVGMFIVLIIVKEDNTNF